MFFLTHAKGWKRRHALRQAIESLENRVLLAYTLDPSFDSDGIAFGAGGGSFVIQSDNKIVAPVNGNHALHRYNVDGSIDTTFNGDNNGTVTPFSFGQIKQSGGKFIISGGNGQVARLNSSGTLDTTFGGGDGIAQVPFGIAALLIAPDGKIVLVGDRYEPNPDYPDGDQLNFLDVARLNSDGSLDTTFAGDGTWEVQEGGMYARLVDGGVQSDGKIIVAEQQTWTPMEGTNYYTWRFNADGTGDNTFHGAGGDSYTSPPTEFGDLQVAPDDSYFLVNAAQVEHFNQDGTSDANFNVDGLGLANQDGSIINSVTPLADSKILVSGYINQSGGQDIKAFVARLLPNGNPDSTFSGTANGMVIVNRQASTFAFTAAVDSLNRVIVGGANGAGQLEPNNWIARLINSSSTGQHPFRGSPFNVGDTIQAEDYDSGGEGVAYHDTDAANLGGAYRTTESVDVENSTDAGGGYDVGFTAQGEWLEYTISIPKSGAYSIDTRVASALSGGLFHYEIDGRNVSGPIAIPNTGGWQNWTNVNTNLGTLTAGNHTLRLAFDPSSNTGGQGNINWLKVNSGATPIGNGLRGEYYNNMDFTALGLIRNDSKIDFNWGNGTPDPVIGPDTFSVIWKGQLRAPTTGTYTFYTTTDDGASLSVNGQTIIDHLSPQPSTEWSGTINLVAGNLYDIEMRYFDRYNSALAKLQWAGPGIIKQVVPTSVLFSPSPTGDFEAPSQVQNFRGDSTSNELEIFWDAASDNVGIGGYEIVLNGTDWIKLNPNARSYTFGNLQPDTGYFVSLRAFDLAGNRGPASTMSISTKPATTVSGLKGEYFNNSDFTAPVLTRTDANINFNWGTGSPAAGIDPDTFSVRWTGKITTPDSGRYTFYTTTDDGVRLWVNGQLLIDKLAPQAATEWSGSIDLVGGQVYDIRMDYFDRSGGAQAKLSWSGPGIVAKQVVPPAAFSSGGSTGDTQAPTVVSSFDPYNITQNEIDVQWGPASDNVGVSGYELRLDGNNPMFVTADTRTFAYRNLQPSTTYQLSISAFDAAGNHGPGTTVAVTTPAAQSGNGLSATYFNNMDFTSPVFTRTDVNINFNWGSNSPDPSKMSDPDTFSVRWTGFITVPTTGHYTFYTTTDDGARLTINGQRIIDKLVPQAATEWSGSIDLVAGQKYSFTMEYFDRFGGALAKLQWAGPGISKQVVPTTAFNLT